MPENVRSTERALDLLEILSEERGAISLTELASRASLSKTTAHRLMQTLCARNYAIKTADSKYLVGPKVIELASYHIEHLELYNIAKPYLSELYSAYKMTVYLGKVVNGKVVYVEVIDRKSLYVREEESGLGVPAYPASIGKCMYAAMSGDEIDEMLYNHPLERYTDKTITDPTVYKKVLMQVRKDGWAINDEEYLRGSRCVGAPVYDYTGATIACIAMNGDLDELSDEKLPIIVEAVKNTAALVSRGMGYLP